MAKLRKEGEGSEAPPKLTTTTEEPFSKENSNVEYIPLQQPYMSNMREIMLAARICGCDKGLV